MKLFIDTANVEEIREAASYGILAGVTTNPSLIAKEGRKLEDVIQEIARRALTHITSVVPASSGASVLGLGRKNPEGVKISIVEEDNRSQISVDAYVLVRYGLRIPDVAWDLQEFLKNELEGSTGYEVKAVNIYVQGVYFGEAPAKEEKADEEPAPKAVPAPAGE